MKATRSAGPNLKEFQLAAVKRICERLNDPRGSGRFLLADEVGLGKTVVARGVLDQLAGPCEKGKRGAEGLVCVYLCSNLEIAEQNRDKLSCEKDREPPARLTLLAEQAHTIKRKRSQGERQLFLFTPGTSLSLGASTGVKAERRLLLAFASRWRPEAFRLKRSAWVEFFRCGAGQNSEEAQARWRRSCRSRALDKDLKRLRRAGILRDTHAKWTAAEVKLRGDKQSRADFDKWPEVSLSQALDDCVRHLETAHEKSDVARAKRNRNLVIGTLRKGLAEAALEFLSPDVVLVDEFQRFREVIKIADNPNELAGRLFLGAGKRPRILILSATPYKAVTLDHEKEQHYEDFEKTLRFLLGPQPNSEKWLSEVKGLLGKFKDKITAETVDFPQVIEIKDRLEARLKEVMCRTERSRYLTDEWKGVKEHPDPREKHSLPLPSEASLSEFVALRLFLLQNDSEDRPLPSIMDFWKSCSSIMNFMDSNYAVIRHLKRKEVEIDARLLRPESELAGTADRNLKVRTLVAGLRKSVWGDSDAKRRWPFLWAKPSYLYYPNEFFRNADPAKFLVFSRWRFVPKAISFLASGEFENTVAADDQPIELNTESLKVCWPLGSLAGLVDPARFAVEASASRETWASCEKSLREAVSMNFLLSLEAAGIGLSSKAGKKQFWPALLKLEQWSLDNPGFVPTQPDGTKARTQARADELLRGAIASESHGLTAEARSLLKSIRGWSRSNEDGVEFPASMLEDAVELALSSPAICLLRAAKSVFPEAQEADLLAPIAQLAFSDLRTYLNKGYVQGAINRHSRQRRYASRVLRFCFDAHFQAVIDEYAYLVRNVLGRSDVESFCDHLGRVFAVSAATPNINVPRSRSGRIRERRAQKPVNFAMAFGDEKQEDDAEPRASRKTSVREAFNSPFWPFVLATTSVGQEGLDFHLYCRDVMHWNLPANPVDLEQREGRINRFDGLVVRRNIQCDYPLRDICPTTDQPNHWARVFEQVAERPKRHQQFKHGLFPHWVFEQANHKKQLRIQRHLAFFDGSRDRKHYERLKKYLYYYRLAFGQARQQDLLDRIVDRPDEAHIRSKLQACMINLSPFSNDHAWEAARRDVRKLSSDPAKIRDLVKHTRALFRKRGDELREVETDLEALWSAAAHLEAQGHASRAGDLEALAALVYLLNPYDDRFDGLEGAGLEDDVAVIQKVGLAAFGAKGMRR